MIGKNEKVLALLTNVGKEKYYDVQSLLHARCIINVHFNGELAKFNAAVNAAYPLVSFFAPPKAQEEQVFEPTKGE